MSAPAQHSAEYYHLLFVAAYDAYMGTDQYGGRFGDDPAGMYASGHRTPTPIEDIAGAERGKFGYTKTITLASIEAARSAVESDWETRARNLAAAVNDLLQYEEDEDEWQESFDTILAPAMVAIVGPDDGGANCYSGSRDSQVLADGESETLAPERVAFVARRGTSPTERMTAAGADVVARAGGGSARTRAAKRHEMTRANDDHCAGADGETS